MDLIFIKGKIKRLMKLGPFGAFKCLYHRHKLKRLVENIGIDIDPWHIYNNFFCRYYKRIVVNIVNSLKPEIVVEVGCGIGEIISRVNASTKIGIDINSDLIKLAKIINAEAEYIVGDFSTILSLPFNRIDCLLTVNVIHGISQDDLRNYIKSIIDKKKIKYILTDNYKKSYPYENKTYSHNLESYDERITLLEIFDDGEGYRDFFLWRVDYER